MPKIITKYKLHPAYDYEVEYEVTRVKVVETRKTMTTDEDGYSLSDRHLPKAEKVVRHGIEAISLPSRKPAHVEILETKEVSEEEALVQSAAHSTITFADAPPPPPPVHREESEPRAKPIQTKHLMDNDSGPMSNQDIPTQRPAPVNLSQALNPTARPMVIPKNEVPIWADDSQSRDNNGPEPF